MAAAGNSGLSEVAAPALAPCCSRTVATLYGDWFEGAFQVAQFRIGPTEYRGFTYPSAFRPAYFERDVDAAELPINVRCCIIAPQQYAVVNGRFIAKVIEVFADTGTPASPGPFFGPIDTFVVLGTREIVSIQAPNVGRRAHR